MHNDREWFIGQKLSRPSDDEFLYIVVEILFTAVNAKPMSRGCDAGNRKLHRKCTGIAVLAGD
jgi:hypothetical protein